MANHQDWLELTNGLTIDDDCPLCRYSWAGCAGKCIEHETIYGMMGPFHLDFNDDCPTCKEFENGCIECIE